MPYIRIQLLRRLRGWMKLNEDREEEEKMGKTILKKITLMNASDK